jgi:Cu/Ag efflux pump CusA
MQKENIFSKIIRFSILNPKLIIITTIAILVASIYSLQTIKFDILPEINKPIITVFAPADGLASEEVETLVLTPLENAILGAPGVEKVRGAATFGQAILTIEFTWGSDIYKNRQIIEEYISKASLPKDVEPTLAPPSSIMGEFLWVGIKNNEKGNLSGQELRSLADWVIRPQLLQVKGVSEVLVQGGDVKELRLELDQDKLNNYGLSFSEVVEKLDGVFNNASGGILVNKGKEYPIRLFSPFTDAINQAENIVVGQSGSNNFILSEVAKVSYQDSPVRGSASVDGENGVILRIIKQADVETLSLSKEIDEKIASIQNSLPENTVLLTDLFRQETFISNGLGNVQSALLESAIMVIIITFLFLLNWRATGITLLAIPLSILITFIVFKLMGLSINVMTLGGLAVAVGELVDDAIIGVENSLRRLSDRNWRNLDITEIIVRAIGEVRGSIIYATILVAEALELIG